MTTNTLLEKLKLFTYKTCVTTPPDMNWNVTFVVGKYLAEVTGRETWDVNDLLINVVGLDAVNREGRYPKRVSSAFRKHLGIKLTSAQVSEVGNIAAPFFRNAQSRSYIVDIATVYDWRDGQFGHEGSCYWGGSAASRDTLEGSSVCLRYYSSMDDDDGIGRCWVVPTFHGLALFNAYGPSLETGAKVIRELLNLTLQCKRVTLYNGHSESIPYINGDSGLVMYDRHEPDDEVDINLPVVYGKYHDEYTRKRYCVYCGTHQYQEDMYYVNGWHCLTCRDTLFTYCECCENYVANDRINHGNWTIMQYGTYRQYSHVCNACLYQGGYSRCNVCDQWTDDRIIYQGLCLSCRVVTEQQ